MAMAIVLATVAAQADQVWLTIDNVYRAGTDEKISATGYFIYNGILSQEEAVDEFYSAGASSYESTIASSAALEVELVGGGWGAEADVNLGKMYFLCFDQDNNYMYVSPVANTVWDDMEARHACNIDALGTSHLPAESASSGFQGAGWYTQSVPEPTSGLLMLLGVAGLALKRKRA